MKQYIIDIKGVVIPEDEWNNTSFYRVDNSTGEMCEISFDKDDIDADANFVKELEKGLINCFDEIKDLKFDKMDKSSQNFRNNNFNDRLINLEENKIKFIDEELKRIDTLEQAFNREF